MRSYLLPRRFCEKPLNYAAEADPTRAFDSHDISGSQEAEQCIDSVIGGWPQSTPIRLRQSVVECRDRVPHEEDPVDPRSGKRHGELAVKAVRRLAEFQHIAEHRHPSGTSSWRNCSEDPECCAHHCRTRVVALVDQSQRTAAPRKFVPSTAPRQLLKPG